VVTWAIMGARMTAQTASAEAADRAVAVRRFVPRFEGNDEVLVQALREGNQAAASELVRRYGPYVERVLARILGVDGELPDLLHDVFLNALDSIHSLKTPSMLKEWLRGVTVFVARGCLRRRRRRQWLVFRRSEDLPDVPIDVLPSDAAEALVRTYRALAGLPADERIVFTLRFMAEMELTEVAQACQVSLATIKRRLDRAQDKFTAAGRKDPVLREWIESGARWSVT
jgi:RNA polymerase sigma-70 factor (ECF subfamily)